MIYPAARSILLAGLGAPIALGVALASPKLWLLAPTWLVLVLAVMLIDAALAARPSQLRLTFEAPATLAAGAKAEVLAAAHFTRTIPAAIELILESNGHCHITPARQTITAPEASFTLTALRRGQGALPRLWTRWRGPLGLIWRQRTHDLDRTIPITLDIAAVKDAALRLFARDTSIGIRLQRDLDQGSEFNNLREFQPGMDRRTIDWKQSARHGTLLAKEFHVERNHHIVLAIDSGRAMCEPVSGLARLDHALNAALLLAYVSLKMGDRAQLFAFDARVRTASPAFTDSTAFTQIQQLAAAIDYSAEETNYTLGLTALSARLRRRSLVVIFTEFPDATAAEQMLETMARVLTQHLVLFVVMRDEELESLQNADPVTPEDVSRAVVAAALAQQRDMVIERLQRMGALILEAEARQIGPALIARYVAIKQRDRL